MYNQISLLNYRREAINTSFIHVCRTYNLMKVNSILTEEANREENRNVYFNIDFIGEFGLNMI